MGVIAAVIALCLLAGCAITPRRVELSAKPAASECTQGCFYITSRRILFRYSF